MATYTDNFNRANGALGSNWITASGTAATISSNQVNTGAAVSYGKWVADATTNAHYSEYKYVGAFFHGPAVCMGTFTSSTAVASVPPTYVLSINSATQLVLRKKPPTTNTYTTLLVINFSVVSGNIVRLEWDGVNTLTAKVNGSVVGTYTDASPITGQKGVGFNLNSTSQTGIMFDDWAGGDLVTSTPVNTTDTPAVTVTETSTVASSTSTTDNASVTVADTSSLVSQSSRSDAVALSITDTSNVVVQVNSTDTAAVSVADSSSVSSSSTPTQQSASDSLAISVGEAATLTASLSRSDNAGVSVVEASAVSVSAGSTDATSVSVADTSSLQVTSSRADTASISLSELASVAVYVTRSDTASVSATETATAGLAGNYSAYDTAVTTDNPLIRYAFENGTTQTGSLSGTQVVSSGFTTTGGVAGSANGWALNGDDSIGFTTSTAIFGDKTFAVEAWFKSSTSDANDYKTIVRRSNGNAHFLLRLRGPGLAGVSPGCLEIYNSNDAGTALSYYSPARYDDNVWHHVVATGDGTNINLYVDGAQVNTGVMPTGTMTEASSVTHFGAFAGTELFQGSLDEIAVYGQTLTAARVLAHFQAPTTSFTNVNGFDTAAIAITESASVVVRVSTTDTPSVAVTDSSTTSVNVSRTDTASVSVVEGRTIAVFLTTTDNAAIGLVEARDLQAAVSRTDALVIALTEQSTVTQKAAATSNVSIWNGSDWVEASVYVFTNGQWKETTISTFDGNTWN